METKIKLRFYLRSDLVRKVTLTTPPSWADVSHWLWVVFNAPVDSAVPVYINDDGQQVAVSDDESLSQLFTAISNKPFVECRVCMRRVHVNDADEAKQHSVDDFVDDSPDASDHRGLKISVSSRPIPANVLSEPANAAPCSPIPIRPANDNSSVAPDPSQDVVEDLVNRLQANPYRLFSHGEGVLVSGAPWRLHVAQLLRGPEGARHASDIVAFMRRNGIPIDIEDDGGLELNRSPTPADRRRARRHSRSPYPPPAYGMHHPDHLLMASSPPPAHRSPSTLSLVCQIPSAPRNPRTTQETTSPAQYSAHSAAASRHGTARSPHAPAGDGRIPRHPLATRTSTLTPQVAVADAAQRCETPPPVTHKVIVKLVKPDDDLTHIRVRQIAFNRTPTWEHLAALLAASYDTSPRLLMLSHSPLDTTLPSWWACEGLERVRGPTGLSNMLRIAFNANESTEFAVLEAMAGGGDAVLGFGTVRFQSASTNVANPGMDVDASATNTVEQHALRHTRDLQAAIARSGMRRVRPANRAPRVSSNTNTKPRAVHDTPPNVAIHTSRVLDNASNARHPSANSTATRSLPTRGLAISQPTTHASVPMRPTPTRSSNQPTSTSRTDNVQSVNENTPFVRSMAPSPEPRNAAHTVRTAQDNRWNSLDAVVDNYRNQLRYSVIRSREADVHGNAPTRQVNSRRTQARAHHPYARVMTISMEGMQPAICELHVQDLTQQVGDYAALGSARRSSVAPQITYSQSRGRDERVRREGEGMVDPEAV
ncbi:hypothetical protein EVJ58_g3114 [Rhodofomes roseus]|uniref:PB1 domain-containing protein n=1 Tax=Rhodofomes roseus TaxID=34475 RepID=A0A4Y9YMP9_9APHY|nr:hypothetical protein EVJ58_g3114 [Rhodofomes roseus]